MRKTVMISVRIPEDLKRKAKLYGINISKVVREALEREIRIRELDELKKLHQRFKESLKRIDKDTIVSVIRETREEK